MYAKNLVLNRNVDNVLQFQFINQAQKPVDIYSILNPRALTVQIVSPGTGYTNGTYTVPIQGGTYVSSTIDSPAYLTVVVANGIVTTATINSSGAYAQVPSNPVTVTGLPAGTGATFSLTWSTQTIQQVTCRILNAGEVLLEKALSFAFSGTTNLSYNGIMELVVTSDELVSINPQDAYYSLEIPLNHLDQPVFVDDNAGARGVMRIVNSVLPAFTPSQPITIPSHVPNQDYYSSSYNTKNSNVVVMQTTYANFVGNVGVFGSTFENLSFPYEINFTVDANADPVNTLSYTTEHTGTEIYQIEGFHPYVFLGFSNANVNGSNAISGHVTQVLAR